MQYQKGAKCDKIGKAYFTIIGKTEDDYIKLIKTKLANDAKVYISSDPVVAKFVEIVLRDKFKLFNISEIVKEIEDELDDDYIEIKSREFGIKLGNISDKLAGLGIKIYPGKKANPSRPYLAVTNEFLSDHKDFDTSILDKKENINKFYNDYKKSLEQSAVNEVIDSII